MRTRSLLVGLAALTLAGCAGTVSQAPSVAPSPIPSTAPPVTSAEPAASPVILGVGVHWDGTKCTYDGPTDIRDGTTARFDFTFDEGTDPPLLVVVGVTPGTTWQMITETARTAPASELPVWAVGDGFARIDPGTSALYTLGSDIGGQPVGGYHVGCLTAPADQGGTDKIYPAALVKLAGPAADKAPGANPNVASPEVVTRVDAIVEALKGNDLEAYRAYYAPDASLWTVASMEGLDLSPMEALRREYDNFHESGTTMERTSDVMQLSNFVVYEFTFNTPGFPERTGMAVLQFDDEGLVVVDHGFTD